MFKKITCQICNQEIGIDGIGQHLKHKHQINNKQYYDKYIKKDNEGICPECGKETTFYNINVGYLKYCSLKCSRNSIEIKEKFKQTCLKKYGSENPRIFKKIINKFKKTRYINSYNKILKFKEVKPIFSLQEYKGIRNNNKDTVYKWQCIKCGNIFEDHIHSKLPRCLICHPLLSGFSKQEKQVVSYIKSIYSGPIEENTRQIITPYELDIYLPELKLAVEYNGNYWHSMLSKNYHSNKTNLCQSKGINLLHIAESDWLNRNDTIKDKITEFLNINNNI